MANDNNKIQATTDDSQIVLYRKSPLARMAVPI